MMDTTNLAAIFAALAEIPARMAAMERVVNDLRADVEGIKAALPPAHKSISEAAKIFGVSIPTMRRWVKKRKVPTVTVENTVRVDMSRLHGVDAEEIARKAEEARRLPAARAAVRSC
jgi:DNA-binding transcriptional ArsR family regulator